MKKKKKDWADLISLSLGCSRFGFYGPLIAKILGLVYGLLQFYVGNSIANNQITSRAIP